MWVRSSINQWLEFLLDVGTIVLSVAGVSAGCGYDRPSVAGVSAGCGYDRPSVAGVSAGCGYDRPSVPGVSAGCGSQLQPHQETARL